MNVKTINSDQVDDDSTGEKQTTIDAAKQIIDDLMNRGFVVTVESDKLRVRPEENLLYRDRLKLKVYQRPILEYWQELQEAEGIKPEANQTEQATGSPSITQYAPDRTLRGPALYPGNQ